MPIKKSVVKKAKVLDEDEVEDNEISKMDELEEDADAKDEETLGDDEDEEASWDDDGDDFSTDEEE